MLRKKTQKRIKSITGKKFKSSKKVAPYVERIEIALTQLVNMQKLTGAEEQIIARYDMAIFQVEKCARDMYPEIFNKTK
jgi:hypothetical protein